MLMSLSNIFHYAEVIVASKNVNRVKYNYVSIVLAHTRQTPTNHLTIIIHQLVLCQNPDQLLYSGTSQRGPSDKGTLYYISLHNGQN